jgi:putative acetyltransferase
LCGIAGTADRPALLGPLAVAPGWQRRGIGTALVRDGLRRLREIGATQVLVLGDPAYYGRFGFRPESGVIPPGPVPPQWREAWQSLALGDGAVGRGRLDVPPPWRRPELWTP